MDAKPKCFVVMPMSDIAGSGYDPGHWDRVYDELLSHACRDAGFEPNRADSTSRTSIIIVDVLRHLYNAEMVLSDLSGLNANVFFELGLRQAFDKRVVIVHDERTPRPFDTSQLRDWEYHSSLRIDLARKGTETITKALRETAEGKDHSSLVQLLNIEPAKLTGTGGDQDQLRRLVGAVDAIGDKIAAIEDQLRIVRSSQYVFPGPATLGYPGVSGATGATGMGLLGGDNRPLGAGLLGKKTLG